MTTAERVNLIMDYESGDLDLDGTLRLFSDLIATGACWSLQGSYGRVGTALIRQGLIDRDGVIDWDAVEEVR